MNPCEVKISNDLAALQAEFKAYDAVMQERDQRYKDKFDAQEKAVQVAQENTKAWQANSNEWRKAMDDRERNFMSKAMGYVIGGLSTLTLVMALFDRLAR